MNNRIQLSENIQNGIIFPFGPGLVYDRVSDDIVNFLKDSGQRSKLKNNDVKHRLTDSVDSWKLELFNEEKNILKSLVKEKIEKYIQTTTNNNLLSVISFDLDDPWINYQNANDFNPSHYHPAAFSYIIYIDIPDKIRKESFEGPPTSLRGLIEFSYNNAQYIINPKANDMILFPSEIYHSVNPFNSDVVRISVAGNVHNVKVSVNNI